jgi:hypothetical protein
MITRTQEVIMNTNARYTNRLELFFDWQFIKHCDFVLVSDDKIDYHMFMIYDSDGALLHGFHIERIQ